MCRDSGSCGAGHSPIGNIIFPHDIATERIEEVTIRATIGGIVHTPGANNHPTESATIEVSRHSHRSRYSAQ